MKRTIEAGGKTPSMSFYYRVVATNQATFAFQVEAENSKQADAYIANLTGAVEWERIEKDDIPLDMVFKPLPN